MSPNSQNPFVVGTPIVPERFIGRNSLIEAAFDQIAHRSHLAVWGGLKMGKTSFLAKLASPDTWRQQIPDSSLAVIVGFSCEEIKPFTPSGFWKKVLSLLKDNLHAEPELQANIDTLLAEGRTSKDTLRQVLGELRQREKFLVLLLDDYDIALVKNDEYSEENMQQFLSDCRQLAVSSERIISIIVTSKKRLTDLGPRLNPNQSPWYNHYLFQQIKPFDNTEITQLLQPFNKPIKPELRQALEKFCGGHPALLQITCFLIYQELCNDRTPQVEEFIREFESSTQDFFADTWQRCNTKDQNLLMLMALEKLRDRLKKRQYDLKDVDLIFTQNERSLTNLEEQGVIKRVTNNANLPYLFTSSLMEKWVIQEIWNSDEDLLKNRDKEFPNFMSHEQLDKMKKAIIWVGQNKNDVVSDLKFVDDLVKKYSTFLWFKKYFMKKYMPERNPYIIGPPVEKAHQFFGRQLLLKNIKDSLQRKTKFILLSGQRRIGKSSVLRNIPLFVNNEEFFFVHCDLQACSHSNIGQILHTIAHEVFLYFKLNKSILKPLLNADLEIICQIFNDRLLPKIFDVLKNKKLVLLLDEFDVVSQNNPEQAVQFLGFLEKLIKQQEELFVIAVVGRYINSMPNLLQSFQGALFYEIGLLDDNDAQRLITEPAQNILQYQEKTIAEILKFSSGHPYYTQVLCYEIFNLLGRNKKNLTNPTILPHHVGIVVPKAIESAGGGLGGFWEGLSVIERVVISAVAEAQQQNPPQDPLTLLEDYELEPTDSLEETIQLLINKGFLDSSPMKIKVELVRCWLVKCHQFRDEIRKEF